MSIGGEGGEGSQKMDTVSDTSSQKALRQIDQFELEKFSNKVICLRPQNAEHEGTLMVQHNEAVFWVRRHIIEKAKNYWKEQAKDLNTNLAVGLTALKQKNLDAAFERKCIEHYGYELGEQFDDLNMRVTFKTFLKQDDYRL